MMQDFAQTIFRSDLLKQAAATLEKKLAQNGQDCELLSKLGEVYRKSGELEKAADFFAQLSQLLPGNPRAGYMKTLLTGLIPPAWPAEDPFQPAPFVLLKNYLPVESHQTLLSFVAAVKDEFASSKVLDGYRPNVSRSLTLYPETELFQHLRAEIAALVPTLWARLQQPPFKIGFIQLEIKAYRDGHFFRTHRDTVESEKRRLNFGYFFHRQPRPYSGGDLLLFDTDFSKGDYFSTRFTRILPEDNCAIIYLSDCYHTVVPVKCNSDDFVDSRFAIIGHICEQEAGES